MDTVLTRLALAGIVAVILLIGILFLTGEPESQAPSLQEKQDIIRVSSPRPNAVISSPLELRGTARGPWYFEADFPVRLLDGEENEIAVTPVQAQSEWMTTDFVPFEGTLEFEEPGTPTGTLLFEKSNPSGLPEHADVLRVPVRF